MAIAEQFLDRLIDLARLPAETFVLLAEDKSGFYSSHAPKADLNVFPLPDEFDTDLLWRLRDSTGTTCLFTRDGGDESALA